MKESGFLVGFLAFFLLFTIVSWDYPFVSALYPRMLLACGFALAGGKIVLLLKGKTALAGVKTETHAHPKRMWVYLGSGILYIVLMPIFGFILGTLCVMVLLFGLFKINMKTTLGLAIVTSLILYSIFALALGIPLPKGPIEHFLLGLL